MNNGLQNISRPLRLNISAWVVFDGTTGAILDSERIKSVTRSTTGTYTIELDFAMPSINWMWGAHARSDSGSARVGFVGTTDADATTTTRIITTLGVATTPSAALYDPDEVFFYSIGGGG